MQHLPHNVGCMVVTNKRVGFDNRTEITIQTLLTNKASARSTNMQAENFPSVTSHGQLYKTNLYQVFLNYSCPEFNSKFIKFTILPACHLNVQEVKSRKSVTFYGSHGPWHNNANLFCFRFSIAAWYWARMRFSKCHIEFGTKTCFNIGSILIRKKNTSCRLNLSFNF